jgi:hypothetical protein
MSDGIDPAMDRMEGANRYAVLDRSIAQPKRSKLPTADHTVLATSQIGQGLRGCSQLPTYFGVNCEHPLILVACRLRDTR